MNINSKHLSSGSPCPPFLGNNNVNLRIYSMRFCPYAQRVLLVAEAKGIPHEIVNCNLKQKPEFLFEKNTEGKVPVIEWNDGRILTESLIICDYFDEIDGEIKAIQQGIQNPRKLHSPDPLRKAQDRIAIEFFNCIIRLYYKIAYAAQDDPALASYFDKLKRQISRWEGILKVRDTRFFGGELPGMLDYMIWPWMERLPILELFHPQLFDYNQVLNYLSHLSEWEQSMKKDAAVAKIFLDPQLHFTYTSSSKAGSPNYDLLSLSQL